MNAWTSEVLSWAIPFWENSIRAIPLILLLLGLQRWGKRWIDLHWLSLLWLLPIARLLIPWHLPSAISAYNLPSLKSVAETLSSQTGPLIQAATVSSSASMNSWTAAEWFMVIWLAGCFFFAALTLFQSWAFHRRIVRERPCTDSRYLNLLEDIKAELKMTTPVSLLLTRTPAAPALYGVIRPRLLISQELMKTLSDEQIECIFRHELIHLQRWDIAMHWASTFCVILHWFNPFVWCMARSISEARELACDAAVIRNRIEPRIYSELILHVAESVLANPVTAGLAGIAEEKSAVVRRIEMIMQKPTTGWWKAATGFVLAGILGIGFLSDRLIAQQATEGDVAIAASIPAAQAWVQLVDEGKYADSYRAFCVAARAAITEESWVKTCQQVRPPLGKMISRILKSRNYTTALPTGEPGKYVILQYDGEYENFKSSETVTMMQDKDGVWRSAGYYIHPR